MAPARRSADAPIESLTPRRRELLELLAKGFTNDEIGSALGISAGTVRVHVTAILAHLDVTNRTEAAAAFVAWESQPAQIARVLERPAIAVLPLVPLDADARTRTAAMGLTEDLAALFARWCWFPVISTLSTASARALTGTLEEVGRALHARFLVDGSVRPTSNGLRVSLHIDDAETGTQIWTDRRDLHWDRLVEEQDELALAVVATTYPLLVSRASAPWERARPLVERSAWELAHEGMMLRAQREAGANQRALALFDEALAREPRLTLAHFGRGLAAYDALLNQWLPAAEALQRLHGAAMRCLDEAPHAAEGYFLSARHLQSLGDWSQAIEPLESAIARNPSFALAHAALSQSLQATGQIEASLVRMRHAVRLGPRAFQAGVATLHFMLGEPAEALVAAEGALATTPHYAFARGVAAASAYELGDLARARHHLEALRTCHPGFVPESFRSTFGPHVESVDRFTTALRTLDRGA